MIIAVRWDDLFNIEDLQILPDVKIAYQLILKCSRYVRQKKIKNKNNRR